MSTFEKQNKIRIIVLASYLILYLLSIIKILIDTGSYKSFGLAERIIVVLLDDTAGSRSRALHRSPHVPQMVGQVVMVGISTVAGIALQVALLRMDHLGCTGCRTHLAVLYPAYVVAPGGRSSCRGNLTQLRTQGIIQITDLHRAPAVPYRVRKVQVVVRKVHPRTVFRGIAVQIVGIVEIGRASCRERV